MSDGMNNGMRYYLPGYTIPMRQYDNDARSMEHSSYKSMEYPSTSYAYSHAPALEEYPSTYNDSSRYFPPGNPGSYKSSPRKRLHNNVTLVKQQQQQQLSKETAGTTKPACFMGRDESYPEELNALIKPLFCQLCNVALNSQKTAACHYESKAHDRKITNWLTLHYPDNPPAVKRFVKSSPVGPQAFHCDICDLPLSSTVHAQQHFAGRRHQLVASRQSDPSGAGFYDTEGKWVRTATKKFSCNYDNGRFGIGADFVKPKSETNGEETVKAARPTKPETPLDESLCCKVCNIIATSTAQMEMHLSGSKHKKKLTASNLSPDSNKPCPNSLLQALDPNAESLPFDVSIYRTPTGCYYCQVCNTSMNNVIVLQQHLQGKKHKIKEKAGASTGAATSH